LTYGTSSKSRFHTRSGRSDSDVGAGEIELAHGLLWLIMITSAENRGWPGDVGLSDLRAAGLPAPSIVRPAKIATVDARDAQRLGTLPRAEREAVASCLGGILGVAFDGSRRM
jgi:mRNA interferase MazF